MARTWDPLIKSQQRVRHPGYAPDFLFPDGGPSDALVMIVQRFTERWTQPVVIEFHSGANTETGARIVATNPSARRREFAVAWSGLIDPGLVIAMGLGGGPRSGRLAAEADGRDRPGSGTDRFGRGDRHKLGDSRRSLVLVVLRASPGSLKGIRNG
jgi:hypothetical protein